MKTISLSCTKLQTDDEIILGPEADSVVYLSTLELQTALRETPADFGDAYYFILEHFYQTYLPESYQFRWATA